MKIRHNQWGSGTVLNELSGGYQLLVNFDGYGKIQVLQKDCEKVQDVELEKTNETISKFIDIVKKNQKGILKNKIISELNIPEHIFNETFQKIIRLPEYHFIPNEQDSKNFKIKFIPEIEASDSLKNKKIVEAFRLGIVPTFAVREITVGREKQIKKVEKWLAKDDESVMIVGQYGQGKSHIIRFIKEKALEEGYLVGYCDIGDESQMHKPKTVLNTIMKSLVFANKEQQKNSDIAMFLKLYAMFVNEPNGKIAKNISKFLEQGVFDLVSEVKRKHNINDLDTDIFTDFIDYLCGDEYVNNYYKMYYGMSIQNYQTSANLVCNMLSSIGHMAASMSDSKSNFKGLILIFDEGETIDSPAYQRKQRDSGINFINGLTEISNNNEVLLSENIIKRDIGIRKIGIRKIGIRKKETRGNKTNLMYSGRHVGTRFSNHKENHVKCLFAFVEGESEVIQDLEKRGVEKIMLDDFADDEKYKLINKVIEIYEKAYDDYRVKDIQRLKNIIIKKMKKKSNTRSIIKITVEALDIIKESESDDDAEINYEIALR